MTENVPDELPGGAGPPPAEGRMREGTELIAEHYQKTYELTLAMWEQRNRTFLLLLVAVGAATLLTFDVSEAQPLLADLIAKTFGVEDAARRARLHESFPYGVIQSILLMVVLYLMVILYHRTAFIVRSYRYLEAVENDIRAGLPAGQALVSFTREGAFYKGSRPALSRLAGAAYIVMLGLLLAAFLGKRIYTDLKEAGALAAADIFLAIPTLLFFAAYALESGAFAPLARLLGARKSGGS